jgi:hypothetical protein
MLVRAMLAADGHAIAATETTFPPEGWAMPLKAIDLRAGEVTRDTRTWKQRATLVRLVQVLESGWSSEVASIAAPRYLAELADSGMTSAVWAGSLVALSVENAHLDAARAVPARGLASGDQRLEPRLARGCLTSPGCRMPTAFRTVVLGVRSSVPVSVQPASPPARIRNNHDFGITRGDLNPSDPDSVRAERA